MNPLRRILRRLAADLRSEPDVRYTIFNLTRQVVIAECVEVADRGAKRRKGLLGRDGLGPGEGLWIVPCESVHTFGMRFPIDLIYLDRKKRVRKVRCVMPAWRLSACLSAHSVIELPAGAVRASKTERGDVLEFSLAASLNKNSESAPPLPLHTSSQI